MTDDKDDSTGHTCAFLEFSFNDLINQKIDLLIFEDICKELNIDDEDVLNDIEVKRKELF